MRFVLIHGGFHGAWCWEKLIPELERLGHTAVAIDLPGHGERATESINPCLVDYRNAVLDVLEPEDVLVGHSMGGLIVTLVADAAPEKIKHLIYISTILPYEGKSFAGGAILQTFVNGLMWLFNGLTKLFPKMALRVYDSASKASVNSSFATWAFYHDCSPELAQWACSKLTHEYVRPLTEKINIPNFWKTQLPRSLILGKQDHILNPKLLSFLFNRFGVVPVYIDAAHSAFLSQPETCAKLMVETVGSKPTGLLKPK